MERIGVLAAEYEQIIRDEKRMKVDAKTCTVRKNELENLIMEELVSCGLQNIKTSSGMTLYKRVDRFVALREGVKSEEIVHEMAQHEQTQDLVRPKFNANTFRSRLKEIEKNGEQLPESLQAMIEIIEKDRIGHNGG